jgi:hypothetical protein
VQQFRFGAGLVFSVRAGYDSQMLKSNLIAAIQFEIRGHDWDMYMKEGIVRPGCSECEVQIDSTNQFGEIAIPRD